MKTIGALLLLVSIAGFLTLFTYKRKGKLPQLTNKHMFLSAGGLAVVSFVSLILLAFGIGKANDLSLDTLGIVGVCLTALAFVLVFYYFVTAGWYRRYVLSKEENTEKKQKILYATGIIGVVLFFVFASLYLEAITPVLKFPLNKLIIDFGNGRGVTYYAVVIIVGALTTYLISDYYVAKAGYGHGKLETCLYLAFPAGIIGGRIWYVIAEWERDFAPFFQQDPTKIFRIWEGGLAIQGGVLLGAAVGIGYMMWKHKDIPILFLIDTVVPAILLAQAIGRWGNFTNKEVYGQAVLASQFPWSILPTWIKNQMMVDGDPTKIYVPLFLVEGICNVIGYYLISFGAGKLLKKYLVPGDQGMLYLVVYGIIRVVLEPLRDPAYQMGVNDTTGAGMSNSSIMAIVFIVGGILGIVALHVLDYLKKKKNNAIDNQAA